MAKMAKIARGLAIQIGCQSGPLESGDFSDIGDLAKMANLDGEGWRLKLDGKSVPLKSGDFHENGDFT